MKTSILNIGNEILDGKIRNSNAEFIMNELSTIGIAINKQMVVEDDEEAIQGALDYLADMDLILTTGGLGTTDDDKTRKTIENYLERNKIDHKEISMKNTQGYFDGVYYKTKKGGIMIFPGPPREMNAMLRNNLNLLMDENVHSVRKTYRISFLNEWDTHRILREAGVTTDIVNTFVDSDGSVYLKLYIDDTDENRLKERLEEVDKKINEALYPLIYANDDSSREKSLIKELIEKGYTLSCAESYTGGKIISSLIEIPDASRVIDDAYVVYNDKTKQKLLGLEQDFIDKHGVVSEEVCSAMLDGLYKQSGSDVCIATTGYAGPSGDVGNVYFGIRYKGRNHIFRRYMKYSRRWIMNKSKNLAIDYTHLIINGLLEAGNEFLRLKMWYNLLEVKYENNKCF